MPESVSAQVPSDAAAVRRLRLTVRGAVQGIGFRPFVYRLARSMGLTGWVCNTPQGALVEAEGQAAQLQAFVQRLARDKPPLAAIASLDAVWLDAVGYADFAIRHSHGEGEKTAVVLPDLATCRACLREIFTPTDRRYRYPFANCTRCGPRYSIVEALPYDRARTTMRGFVMCGRCRAEYDDPRDRRFHAQPIACPACGPQLALCDGAGRTLARGDAALRAAAAQIRQGAIVAVKGLGGFHLVVDAAQEAAVQRLRRRKQRPDKPLALMYPTLAAVRADCRVSRLEARLLRSPAAPIVLLRRRGDAGTTRIAPAIAPGNPALGVMLPYTPLHHLLLAELGAPVVATSGNCAEEPICTEEGEALQRLADIAEAFLIHDRPIARPVDDSVVCVVLGRELVLRRARGYAPLPVALPTAVPPLLAAGAHLKNTIAVADGHRAILSQHIGDLETPQALDVLRRTIEGLGQLYGLHPTAVAGDLHPDYRSTQLARQSGLPLVRVQHHYAHALACLADNGLEGPALGVAWDGTGYGPDGSVWGGEFLHVTARSWRRIAHFRTFGLLGGERAVREPWRTALGVLWEIFGEELWTLSELPPVRAVTPQQRNLVATMLRRRLNVPVTSSVGRLFDAVAALMGRCLTTSFEGQAAMALEFAAAEAETAATYPWRLVVPQAAAAPLVVDWEPLVRGVLQDLQAGTAAGVVAAKFHNALADAIVAVASRLGEARVALSGGCFQNRLLTERAVQRLRDAGFQPYWHRQIPPNDGGIALGQVLAAARQVRA